MLRSVVAASAVALAVVASPVRAAVGADHCLVIARTPLSRCTIVTTGGTYRFWLSANGVTSTATVTCDDGATATLTSDAIAETTFVTGLGTCVLSVDSPFQAVARVEPA